MNSSVNASCEVPIIEAKNLYMEYGSNVILEKINVKDVIIDYISPVIGVHSGPGTMAAFYFSKHRI